jgi:hypothetical protein
MLSNAGPRTYVVQKSRQYPQSCDFRIAPVSQLGHSEPLQNAKEGPQAPGDKGAWGVEAGHEPRPGSPIWRYELLETRQAVQSSAASVTQTPHSRQP